MAQEIKSNNAVNSSDRWKEVAAWTGAGMLAVGATGDGIAQVGAHRNNKRLSKSQQDFDDRVGASAAKRMHKSMYRTDPDYTKSIRDAKRIKNPQKRKTEQAKIMNSTWESLPPSAGTGQLDFGKDQFMNDATKDVKAEGYKRPKNWRQGHNYYDAHIKKPSKGILKNLLK